MKEEIHMIQKNKTWTLVPRPPGKQIIGVKCVYKIKYISDGTVQKNKARLVAKEFSQKAGEDYSETFASVARMETGYKNFVCSCSNEKMDNSSPRCEICIS
ncbi:putative mitochondrial protein [Apostasia shenzhenica]|uniref:Putative mitochondrial protein n=1 Tax=Apostasia shenzhenica TaxID=1088818 RepID=A0A2I0BG47_9ASPA|nr:putative mitochondrial protein [Apostasia shenzhenica]